MKKIFLSLLLSLAVISQCFCLDENDFKERFQQLEQVVEGARAYRLGFLNNDQDKKALLTSLVASLPVYESRDSIESAIDALLQDQFKLQLPDYRIVAIADTELSGHSSDPVFLIVDQNNALQLVVKAFQKPTGLKSKFLREISALDFLHTHLHMGIGAPYPLGVGQTTFQGIHYGLLAQSPAKGERLDAFIKCLKNAEGDDFKAKYHTLEEAFRVSAQSIAKLNAEHRKIEKGRITSKMADKLRNKTQELFRKPAAAMIADAISIDELSLFVDVLIKNTQRFDFVKGYSHFSAHMANVFYDPEGKQISYIDVAKMFDSFSHEGTPLSFSAYDVVRYVHSFRKVAVTFMSFDAMQKLVEEFKQHYFAATNDPYAAQLVQFLEVDSAVGRLLSYYDYDKIADPVKREHHRQVFEMSKKSLALEMQRGTIFLERRPRYPVFGMVVDPKTGIATCRDVRDL